MKPNPATYPLKLTTVCLVVLYVAPWLHIWRGLVALLDLGLTDLGQQIILWATAAYAITWMVLVFWAAAWIYNAFFRKPEPDGDASNKKSPSAYFIREGPKAATVCLVAFFLTQYLLTSYYEDKYGGLSGAIAELLDPDNLHLSQQLVFWATLAYGITWIVLIVWVAAWLYYEFFKKPRPNVKEGGKPGPN